MENVKIDQGLRRFQPRSCRACHGISAKKCMFCGQQWKLKKQDMSDYEIVQFDAYREEIERLELLYKKLLSLRMKSTGSAEVDNLIILHIGDWRDLIR